MGRSVADYLSNEFDIAMRLLSATGVQQQDGLAFTSIEAALGEALGETASDAKTHDVVQELAVGGEDAGADEPEVSDAA